MKLRLRLRPTGLCTASAIKSFADANVFEYSGPRVILRLVVRVRKGKRTVSYQPSPFSFLVSPIITGYT
jgi:hypothetical protein